MEKGKLIVQEKKKGKSFQLVKSDGKKLPVQPKSFTNNEHIQKLEVGDVEVEYELEKGQPTKLIIDGITLENKGPAKINQTTSKQNPQPRGDFSSQNDHDAALAPYNFVPLNQKVLEADMPPHFDKFEGLSGYIELDIKTKSPLFIRGTLTQEQTESNKSDKTDGHYKPAGLYFKLPGSSLRGMIRSLFEIVSYSKLSFIDDKKLYFRSFADASKEFRELYNAYIFGTKNPKMEDTPKIIPGYIKKEGRLYKITEAEAYYRIYESDVPVDMVTHKLADEGYADEIKKKPYVKALFKVAKDNDGKVIAKEIKNHSNQPNEMEGYKEGYLILSGYFNKKKKHWVIGPKIGKSYDVPQNVLDDYKKDSNRNAINLISPEDEDLNKKNEILLNSTGVPCFFIVDENNKVQAFGHTGMFRIAYKKSIKDLLPQNHKKTDLLDMAEAVFGMVSDDNQAMPARVFFEDAVASQAQELEPAYPKILSSPKPSSFQLYLQQNKNRIEPYGKDGKNRTGIYNYDSKNASLAGRKLYWHKDHDDWEEKDMEKKDEKKKDMEEQDKKEEKKKSQYTQIRALQEGAKFKGRIRFDNLSKVELGALLFVLDLPAGCHHKIGMAKPLGLGSIQITPKLTTIDRVQRYKSFTALAETPHQSLDGFKTEFEKHLKEKGIISGSAWDSPELKELKAMLSYERRPSADKSRYMLIKGAGGNEYQDRKILKKPSEYIRK